MAGSQPTKSTLHTPIARLSYPALFEARGVAGDPTSVPKFGTTLIFDTVSKGDPQFKTLMGRMVQAVEELGKADPRLSKRRDWRKPFRDGAEGEYADRAGYGEGTVFIRATSSRAVPCVDRQLQAITDAEKLYPGCYVRAIVSLYAYGGEKTKGNYGISFGLRGLQFVKDGDRLDDAVDVSREFSSLDDPTEDAPFEEGAGGDGGGALSALDRLFGNKS
ncbi:MAG: DUF2815 family protein [Patescibacteria group bacterium]|nr:DUF2815 family protein [Patescibacteria group bacterium]